MNLSGADLGNANLQSVYLGFANLSNANLVRANLTYADFIRANLQSAFLSYANLFRADFGAANLHKANLRSADLRFANFSGANLRATGLYKANLRSASFGFADLIRANFRFADLSHAKLNGAQVLHTDFTESTFTGACIADWQDSSSTILEGVQCDYIFRTYDTGKHQFSGRLPIDPDSTFAPGEFTQRFQIIASALETIDITFTEGIDWQAFFQSFQDLRDNHPDEDIAIQGMERKGDAFVVRLEVEVQADKGAIETEVKQLYAHQLAALEAQYEERLRLQGIQIDEAKQTIRVERQEKATLMGIMATMAENQGSNFDLRGAQIAGGVAGNVQGDQYGGVINNYGQSADDIVHLLTALRTWSQALPEPQQDEVLMKLEDLEADLNKPEKADPKRLGKRLQQLLAAGTAAVAIAGGAANFSSDIDEFTGNVLELGEKVGVMREAIQGNP
ncbi:MAG: pentapeptide repeat-containing protein [Cyanobacteria bacterium P01_C01_bin.120]